MVDGCAGGRWGSGPDVEDADHPVSLDVQGQLYAGRGPDGQPAFYRQVAQASQEHTDEIEPAYAGLDLPVLIVWGTDDSWIPVDRAQQLAHTIPGAQLRLVTGAGHLVQLDQPIALATILVDWLSSQRPPNP